MKAEFGAWAQVDGVVVITKKAVQTQCIGHVRYACVQDVVSLMYVAVLLLKNGHGLILWKWQVVEVLVKALAIVVSRLTRITTGLVLTVNKWVVYLKIRAKAQEQVEQYIQDYVMHFM